MLSRLSAEFWGTFCLVFCGTGAIVIDQETGGVVTHLGVSLVFGAVVLAMILAFGHISGAHLNPAVTLGLCLAGRFRRVHMLPYMLMQLAGALLASAILKYLFPHNVYLGATFPKGTGGQSFFLEFLLSFILMLVILTSTQKQSPNLLAPALAIGATVGLDALFAGPVCGASMNPARSMGPALVGGHGQSLWIYIFAPVLGMAFGSLTFGLFKVP